MTWIKKMYERYQEMVDYVLFGVATTVVNIVVFFLLDTVIGIPYLVANAIAIIASILFAFYTNKKYVFKTHTPTFKAAFREFYLFVGFRLVSGLFDMLSMWILVDVLSFGTNTAKIATQFIIVAVNYLSSKFFVFKG
ncbi:GtrA family protein [Atopococcus tabaci]|uniref:GtrA family protein n=1 Tax=Atopococcus tabaci TaxID=269774 RepID=UPI00240A6F44|nr:GtrA family protein [Atopococcus tabaci]